MRRKSFPVIFFVCGLLLITWSCREDSVEVETHPGASFGNFRFLAAGNKSLISDFTGKINPDHSITFSLPLKTDITSLIPTFTFSGREVRVKKELQISGRTAQNFTSPVTYTVAAFDETIAKYTVSVAKTTSSDHTFLSFSLLKVNNPVLPRDLSFEIDNQKGEIAGYLPDWMDGDLSAGFIASFETMGDEVLKDDVAQTSGVSRMNFRQSVSCTVFAGNGSSKTYRVMLLCPQLNASLPVLKIDADGPINSKETYQTANLQMFGNGITQGLWNSSQSGKKVEIRLRGNSTAALPKKPYRIKFPEKFSPLGLNHANLKSWVLLANDADKTLIRNAVAFRASQILYADNPGHPGFTPSTQFTDVYLNGKYIGNYHLTDQIEVAPGRVPVESLKAIDGNDPLKITGGYLLEMDGFATREPLWFLTNRSITVTVKHPEDEDYDVSQLNYIRELFGNQAENALFSSDFTGPVNGWRKFFDEKTWVDYYIISELTGNPDSWWSTYIYKYRNDAHFYFGPVWDFDIAFSNDARLGDTRFSLMANTAHNPRLWISRFMQDPGFRKAVKNRWNLKKEELKSLNGYIDQLASVINISQRANFKAWDIHTQSLGHAATPPATWEEGILQLKSYLDARFNYLEGIFNSW